MSQLLERNDETLTYMLKLYVLERATLSTVIGFLPNTVIGVGNRASLEVLVCRRGEGAYTLP